MSLRIRLLYIFNEIPNGGHWKSVLWSHIYTHRSERRKSTISLDAVYSQPSLSWSINYCSVLEAYYEIVSLFTVCGLIYRCKVELNFIFNGHKRQMNHVPKYQHTFTHHECHVFWVWHFVCFYFVFGKFRLFLVCMLCVSNIFFYYYYPIYFTF